MYDSAFINSKYYWFIFVEGFKKESPHLGFKLVWSSFLFWSSMYCSPPSRYSISSAVVQEDSYCLLGLRILMVFLRAASTTLGGWGSSKVAVEWVWKILRQFDVSASLKILGCRQVASLECRRYRISSRFSCLPKSRALTWGATGIGQGNPPIRWRLLEWSLFRSHTQGFRRIGNRVSAKMECDD
jgi:hypothetical protein